ncbi:MULTISPECIES: class I SAM-dependent methyltransferase [unclassified Marinobacter]|uniref:class I SAM-dependent methyltransferase n=1 Tax=unclassified Marinobacter TaxID=83889 RepID=UPI00126932B4|nr:MULTISPECIES: class I SAM-dependent methyltransferase [unclassified Marinobacter]QFS86560.1 Ribosomal RNA small subunit methyltransferase C [Marinobacter sp. THAF197a]QFT50343.1 Ribosomal RNA small subunit methyltransferase C [Marinobacter sp. THAF39]
MSALTNTHDVLLRNRDLLQGRLALLGVTEPLVLSQCGDSGLAMSEHAGVYSALAQRSGWKACFGYDTDGLAAADYDTVVVFLPKARAELALRLTMARFLGCEGARLVLIGEKKEGIGGAVKQFNEVASDTGKVDSARHCQVWVGTNSQPLSVFDVREWISWSQLECAGVEIAVAGLPGVFSEGELDAGTRMLLETLAESPLKAERVLDFACGAGVIGSWLQGFAKRQGRSPVTVDGVDVQAQAVLCSEATYARAGLDGQIYAADGLSTLEGRWQAVVTNPPFHSGVKTDTSMTEQFLRDVAGHLVPGGELRLVANSFLPYEGDIQRHIGPVERLAQDRRFTVYRAFRRASAGLRP